MRTHLLVLVALLGCKKSTDSSTTSGSPHSTKDADALWALAPANMQAGFVLTPRALDLLEGAVLRVQTLVQTAPELAFAKAQLDAMTANLGGPLTGLADLGIDKTRGLAWFVDASGEPVVVLPIADRAKLAQLTGQELGTDPNKLGPMTCKTVNTLSACTQKVELLDKLGAAKLPPAITAVGVRGDIEAAVAVQEISGGGVMQLERGEAVAHISVSGIPAPMATEMGKVKATPRVEPERSVAFAVSPITLFAQAIPRHMPLPGGGTVGELLATVSGPVTITIAAGTVMPDVRVPVSDPAPAKRLVDHCKELIPAELFVETSEPGTCRFKVPQYSIELDLWIEDNTIRLGAKQAPASSATAALTPLGKELAAKTWAFAFWGRGTMFGATGLPAMASGPLGDQGAAVVRALTLINELGIAMRVEGNTASGVFGIRTVYANPDDVVTKLLAIPPDDIIAGKTDAAKAIAEGAPSSKFAGDFAAGQGGLMVPTAVIGMIAAVAVPAFMQYMRRSESAVPVEAPTTP